jgi:hypothetical protein
MKDAVLVIGTVRMDHEDLLEPLLAELGDRIPRLSAVTTSDATPRIASHHPPGIRGVYFGSRVAVTSIAVAILSSPRSWTVHRSASGPVADIVRRAR